MSLSLSTIFFFFFFTAKNYIAPALNAVRPLYRVSSRIFDTPVRHARLTISNGNNPMLAIDKGSYNLITEDSSTSVFPETDGSKTGHSLRDGQ